MSEPTELYRRYRPQAFKDMVGQAVIAKELDSLVKLNKVPHAIALTGPSGTGKTTAARILKACLGCSDTDYVEMNGSSNRGIDDMRDIMQRIGFAPMFGKCRIWYIDEAHGLTKDAQNSLLKVMEDTPRHVYFILATTEGSKLLKTIRTRCATFAFKPITNGELIRLCGIVLKSLKKKVAEEVIEKIADASDGSARQALVLLEKVLLHDDEEEQLSAIDAGVSESQAIDLAKLLAFGRGVKWPGVAKVLKSLQGDAEGVRRAVLGFFRACMLNNTQPAKMASLIECFQFDYFASGEAGLAVSCWQAVNLK